MGRFPCTPAWNINRDSRSTAAAAADEPGRSNCAGPAGTKAREEEKAGFLRQAEKHFSLNRESWLVLELLACFNGFRKYQGGKVEDIGPHSALHDADSIFLGFREGTLVIPAIMLNPVTSNNGPGAIFAPPAVYENGLRIIVEQKGQSTLHLL